MTIKHLSNAQLELECELTGPMPMQGSGTVGGREFYFHARHSNWTFEMVDDLGQLPSDTGLNPVFRVAGRFRIADDMTLDEAERLVFACAQMWLVAVRPQI